MADRYWVGGGGSWSLTANWSTTSGGTSGASVPIATDNVIFDANSNAPGFGAPFTANVTAGIGATCANLTISIAATGSLSPVSLVLAIADTLTVTGTISNVSTSSTYRIVIRSLTFGIATNLVVATLGSLTDIDFRDIYVTGTAAPLSGTRIGDLGGVRGITFPTPKTIYWNQIAGGNWSDVAWATSSGGAVSAANFPLAQDTAIIGNTGLTTGNTIAVEAAWPLGTVDMSTRTNAMTLGTGTSTSSILGDWKNGSGTTLTGTAILTFTGRGIQTITSAGKTFTQPITVNSWSGTLNLADALNIGTGALTITSGTFTTNGYAITAGSLSSSVTNVRTINLGASTVTMSNAATPISISTITNLTFNAGTSTFNLSYLGSVTIVSGGLIFYNVNFTDTSIGTHTINGSNTFNNLTITAPLSSGLTSVSFLANQTITGTLTCAGATAARRIFLRSDVLGTQRDLTAGTLVADDCDFRDIEILGTAAGSSPTRAGDCGGNTGITFPAAKTVYWNLAGAQNWSATGWCPSSGGTPDINQFPLAQDIAVFDNTGSVTGAITINTSWNIGTFNASARTGAMTLVSGSATIYGNWINGSGLTFSGATTMEFGGRGTQTITSAGVVFTQSIRINSSTGIVQLADALTGPVSGLLNFASGTFDAVSYNVTWGNVVTGATTFVLKLGSGTWTISGTGTAQVSIWNFAIPCILYKNTADIILSNTGTTARTFDGGSLSYNKLTIGGATGTSTATIIGSNQFTELTSTKTVAHTLALGTTTQTIGKWSVTGTAGNVVTVTGTATLTIAGARVSGVDYLALGTTVINATSPGEFYAGVNSTGGTNAILTAAPTPVTRYWRGGTGTWDATTTTNWSATSGGLGGASVPTSADAVIFDSLSNATAYTVTCTATQLRTAALTMAGPLAGNVTWAGTGPLAIHGNVTLAATGITQTYTGALTFSGSSTGKTVTTNGLSFTNPVVINGVGCGWSLGSAWVGNSSFTITNGAFDTANYALTGTFVSNNSNSRTISLGSSTITSASASPIVFTTSINLTFSAGTSQINLSNAAPTIAGGGQTFYNVSFTSTALTTPVINGVNTFNNLTIAGRASSGISNVSLSATQTINGTLTLSAGTDATMRTFVQSNTIGTIRTLTCAAFSGTDADFRDITITGAAAPVSGTRLGDCKGNSGITFDAAKTVYYAVGTGLNWGGNSWSLTNGASADPTAFPLAQDTAVFPSSPTARPGTGGASTINANYNIGTIDMSSRATNTMTLATGTTTPAIYGNWINGTGTTLTGTGTMTFAGRGSQTITSAGVTFTQGVLTNTPGGLVTLQDAFTTNLNVAGALQVGIGTFSANGYSVTLSGALSTVSTSTTTVRTIAIGSGTWTLAGSGNAWNATTSTNLTVTGTGTISLTSASAKTFIGGSISYSGITLNQGGAGALTISGNNTFANITNTYSATGATSILMAATTQTVGTWTAAGTVGKVLTVSGTSAASPATLIVTGTPSGSLDYLAINNVRAYPLTTTWYAGANSTNGGSLGWYFVAGTSGNIYNVNWVDTSTATDATSATITFSSLIAETATNSDIFAVAASIFNAPVTETSAVTDSGIAYVAFQANINESGTVVDVMQAGLSYPVSIAETSTATDTILAGSGYFVFLDESGTVTDTTSSLADFRATTQETATTTDTDSAQAAFAPNIQETATATDTDAARAIFTAEAQDTATATDYDIGYVSFVGTIYESTNIADFIIGGSGYFVFLDETATATDVATALADFLASTQETAAITDADTGVMGFAGTITETSTATDAEITQYTTYPTVDETATATDTATAPGSTYNPRLAETATATDSPVGYITFPTSISEAITSSDVYQGAQVFIGTLAEAVAATDAGSTKVVFYAALTEAATAVDLNTVAASVFNAPFTDTVGVIAVTDAPGSTYNTSVLVVLTVSDAVIGAYLWNPIDDTQTANWQNVSTANVPGWTNIANAQAAGWQLIPTPQAPGWTDVNDTQSPGWVNINT